MEFPDEKLSLSRSSNARQEGEIRCRLLHHSVEILILISYTTKFCNFTLQQGVGVCRERDAVQELTAHL